MTSSEYKNTIMWTLSMQTSKDEHSNDTDSTVIEILKNLGVPFPHGNLQEVRSVLNSNNYMGWNKCTREQKLKHCP